MGKRDKEKRSAVSKESVDSNNTFEPDMTDERIDDEEEFFHNKRLATQGLLHDLDFDQADEVLNKMANRTYFVVVMYDIVDNRRRANLARFLLGYGERVQYSGFEAYLTAKQIDRLAAKVPTFIDEKEDRVRIYKISGHPMLTVFGNIPFIEHEAFTII